MSRRLHSDRRRQLQRHRTKRPKSWRSVQRSARLHSSRDEAEDPRAARIHSDVSARCGLGQPLGRTLRAPTPSIRVARCARGAARSRRAQRHAQKRLVQDGRRPRERARLPNRGIAPFSAAAAAKGGPRPPRAAAASGGPAPAVSDLAVVERSVRVKPRRTSPPSTAGTPSFFLRCAAREMRGRRLIAANPSGVHLFRPPCRLPYLRRSQPTQSPAAD